MSRIDIGEIRDFAFQLHTANQTGRKIIQGVKTTVTNYIEDGSLKGKAVEASKNYYQMTYIPLCETIIEAMNESEERVKRYIQDFHDQVDNSPDAKIDADGLYELGQMIDRIESKKEALYQRMNSSTEGEMQIYRSQLAIAYKQENILEKYLAFEQSHGAFFDHLTDLVQGIQQTVRELQSNIQFNSQTGGYDLSKLNFATVSRMRKTLGKASATDTTIYDFASYSKVKQGGMWILSKDGKVDIKATEAYNTASFNGELPKESNQATEEGELLKATLESLKQNKDPITGQEISKAQSFGILTSLIFGYTTKVYRGKKFTIPKSALRQANKANADQKTRILKNIEASKKAREASNFEEHLKREKVALEEIDKGGKKRSRNLIDNTDEIAKDIRNINKRYSNGFEQNNSIDSIINSASYYNDTWEQTSAVTRSIADHAFENGNKRTAFDTLNMLLNDFNLKSPLNDTQKWDLIEKLGRKEITDVSKIANILKGK